MEVIWTILAALAALSLVWIASSLHRYLRPQEVLEGSSGQRSGPGSP